MNKFTDTHCHLDFDVFDVDRSEVIIRAQQAGLGFILNPGIDLPSSKTGIKLAHDYPGLIYAAVGFHPNYGSLWDKNSLNGLRMLAKDKSVLAIGEIGLDYYRQHTPIDLQREILLQQLDLAKELALPVILHTRESANDILSILVNWVNSLPDNSKLKTYPGVLHSFSDTLEVAFKAISLNFMIGITGPVTFNNAAEIKNLVANLPLQSILLETDSPFLTPHPYRGRRNEPANIPLIAEMIAKLHKTTIDGVAETTYQNARQLFNFQTLTK